MTWGGVGGGKVRAGTFHFGKEMAGGMGEDGQVPGGARVSHRGFVQAGQHQDRGSKLVKKVISSGPKFVHKLAPIL